MRETDWKERQWLHRPFGMVCFHLISISGRVLCVDKIIWNMEEIQNIIVTSMTSECNQRVETKVNNLLKFICDAITMYEDWKATSGGRLCMNEPRFTFPKCQIPFYYCGKNWLPFVIWAEQQQQHENGKRFIFSSLSHTRADINLCKFVLYTLVSFLLPHPSSRTCALCIHLLAIFYIFSFCSVYIDLQNGWKSGWCQPHARTY